MSAESVNFSNAVFVAIPLESIECSPELTMESAEAKRPRRTTKARKNVDDSTLFFVLLGAIVIVACMPFLGFLCFERAIYSNDVTSTEDASQHIQQVAVVRESVAIGTLREQYSMELTNETFDAFLKDNPIAFVNFHAPWCALSQILFPTWQKVAQAIHDKGMPVAVGHVDCVAQVDVAQVDLCISQKLIAYPTLRWFNMGEAHSTDYSCECNRTLDVLVRFVESKIARDNRTCEELSQMAALQPSLLEREQVDRPDVVWEKSVDPSPAGSNDREAFASSQQQQSSDLRSSDMQSPVIDLTHDSFDQFLIDNKMAFVSFCEPWRSRCKGSAAMWEEFARTAGNRHLPIGVGRVNCSAEPQLCELQGIHAHPTLRWFQVGVPQLPDYFGKLSLRHLVDVAELNVNFKDRFTDANLQIKYNEMLYMMQYDIRGSIDGSNSIVGDSKDSARITDHDPTSGEGLSVREPSYGDSIHQSLNVDISDPNEFDTDSEDAFLEEGEESRDDDAKDIFVERVEESHDGGWMDIVEEIMDYWTMEE